MITYFLTSLFAIANNYIHQPFHEYKINETTSIDYFLTYNSLYNGLMFNNKENIISNFEGNETDCEVSCNNNNNCLGYVLYKNNCCLLSNITDVIETNDTELSFKKIYYHHPPLEEMVINGIVFGTLDNYRNITIFIDLNLNGKLDVGEPFNYTYNEVFFDFYGIEEGTYSIRMVEPDDCRQIYPGHFGSERYEINDGYVDKIVYFTDGGNINNPGLHGGIINTSKNNNIDFSFILGNIPFTNLSFYNDNSIILTITNDVIVNKEGDDIFVNTYLNSSVNANLSVSFDGVNFTFLGELNNIDVSFDLDTINFDLPVRFIRLHFHPTEDINRKEDEYRNIISIYGNDDIKYSQAYSYYNTIEDYDVPIFVYDCDYYFTCETFCYYRVNNLDIDSCYQGCKSFEINKTCNCLHNSSINNFECELGCAYNIEKYVYPNYTLYRNGKGLNNDLIENEYCEDNCFNNILNNCSSNNDCHSLSIDGNEIKSFSSFRHFYHNNSFFLA